MSLFLFLPPLVSAALVPYAWKYRATRGAKPLAALLAATVIWGAGYAFELLAGDTLPLKVLWASLKYVGVVTVPVAWAAFALEYTGHGAWLKRRNVMLLLIMPLVTLTLALTNSAHHWVWTEERIVTGGPFRALDVTFQPYFWVHAAYSYGLILFGAMLIVRALVRLSHVYRGQIAALLVALIAPWIGNVLAIFDLNPIPHLDLTSFGFTASALALAWGILRFRLLDVVPVAHDAVVSSLGDGILVLDTEYRIVDINPAAHRILGQVIGQPAAQVWRDWPRLIERYRNTSEAQDEITLGEGETQRIFERRLSKLTDRRGRHIGQLIVLQDITQRKQAEETLIGQKQLFENLLVVARATAELPTLEATLQNVLNVAVALTGAQYGGSLFLIDGNGQVTNAILARGRVDMDTRQDVLGRVMDQGVAGWVLRNHKTAVVADCETDERWIALPNAPYTARSVLAVPVLRGKILLGILTLIHSQPDHFSSDHVMLMESAADQMSLAIRNAQVFDALRHMADRQIMLYDMLSTISKQHDPNAVASTAVSILAELAGWANVAIALPGEDRQSWTLLASRGLLGAVAQATFSIHQGIIGRAFRTGQKQNVPDVSVDSDYTVGHASIRSELAVPMRRYDRVVGVLDLESDRLSAFDNSDDVLLAESLAEAIALALDNAQLFHATQVERSRLEALIKSTRDGVILVGTDQQVLVMNSTAMHLLRLTGQPEDWLGRSLAEAMLPLRHYAPSAVKATLAEVHRARQGDASPGEGEYKVPPRTIHWLNLPVVSGSTPLGRLLVLHDVTDERAIEHLREDMTHTMVHDLRNPLTGIIGALALLTRGAVGEITPQQKMILGIASATTQRMAGLVNSILDVSRLENGRMPLEWTVFSLADLTADTLQMQETLADEKAIHLQNDVPKTLVPAWGDSGLIGRVLQNLIGNAIKFTPAKGTVCVAARLERREDHPVILVQVSDTGDGIPPEIQNRLFQKFVTGSQEGRGSGLGLAFCKLALETHGERIWVESQPGHGTTFSFSLAVATETIK